MSWVLAKDLREGDEVVGAEGAVYTIAAITDDLDTLEFGLLGPDGAEVTFRPAAFEEVEIP